MSFPTSPLNGAITVVNGITYQYSLASTAWTRVASQVTATTYLNITNTTVATSTLTGALTVAGGVGIGGKLYVGGGIDGSITTAANIAGGTTGQIAYQTGAGATGFAGPGTAGQLLVSAGAAAPTYTSTGSIYVGFANKSNNIIGGTAGQLVYNSGADATGFVGPGTAGQILVSAGTAAPTYTNTSSIQVGFSANTLGGAVGSLPYQTGANATSMLALGTAGYVLTAGGSAPEYVSTASLYVGNAAVANILNAGNTSTQQVGFAANVMAGAAGSLPYQTGANATSMLSLGTAGQILTAGGSAPQYTSTGSVYVGFANKSNNIIGGTAGQLVYNSGADTTGFVGPGTAGQILVSAGTAAPVYTSTGSLYVGNAAVANTLNAGNTSTQQVGFAANTLGGVQGSLPYQSSPNTTAMLGIGSSNAILVSNGTIPSWSTSPTIGGNVTIVGNLTVQGTTTAVDSTVTNVSDPIITIGGGVNGAAPGTNDGKDRGIAFQWHNGSAAKLGFFGYKNGSGKFTFVPDATITSEIVTGTKGAVDVNLAGGTAGQLVYQSAADTTGFVGPGTAGQLLVSGGTSAPVYTNTGSIYVNGAVYAEELRGGTAGQLVYQSAADTTDYVGPGTAGQILVSAGAAAPVYTNTGSLYVGNAATANVLNAGNTATQQVGFAANVMAGAAGSLPYQTGANATAMLALGTSGFVLTAGGSAPQYTSTGSLYVGNAAVANILNAGNTSTQQVGFAANVMAGAANQIPYQSGANATTFGSGLTYNGTTFTTGNISVTGTTNATSTTTGALIVAGGLAVVRDLYVGGTLTLGGSSGGDIDMGFGDINGVGNLRANTATFTTTSITSSLASTSPSTGALTVTGGVGISGKLYVGGGIDGTVTTATNIAGGTAGQLAYQTGAGATGFAGPGTAGQILVSAGAAAPSYTSTGSIYVGFANKSNNIIGGTAGQLVYNSGADTTGFVGPGTAGQILVSAGTAAPTYTNTGSIYVGNAATANVLNAGNTSTQQVGFAANVMAGAAGSIVYQTGANATSMLALGTSGFVLTAGGSAPQYTSTGSLYVGNAATANVLNAGNTATQQVGFAANVMAGAANQIPYQSGANATTFGAGLTYDGTTLATGNVSVTGTTDATSTTTGAFKVVGGAGIGGNLFVGGSAYLTGDLYVDGTSFTVNSTSIATGDKTITLGTATTSAALASNSGIQIGTVATPYATWLYDGSANWVSAGPNAGGIKATSAASASSTSTGALQVVGGVGVGGGMYVGGIVTATNMFIGPWAVSTSSALTIQSGGASQGTAGTINFSTGLSASVSANVATVTLTTGTLMTTTVNLVGGAAGSVPYQTGAGATSMLSLSGTAGALLIAGATAPAYSTNVKAIASGTASTSTQNGQTLQVTANGVGIVGDSSISGNLGVGTVYATNIIASGTVDGGGVRKTASSSAPASPTVGDKWYNTSSDVMYEYVNDGTTSYWVDTTGPVIANASAAYITLSSLKAIAAASADFAAFKSAIAAL
jgi:hypothetical protein